MHLRTQLLRLLLATLLLPGLHLRAADETPPALQNVLPEADTSILELRRVEVFFSEDVQGVDVTDLLINGVPATNMVIVQASQYQFEFPTPPNGTVQIAWAAGNGITDLEGNPFAGGSWTYNLNPALALFQVRINEFMANNQSGIRDEDGSYEDWIELYNASTLPVNLDGCWLTDTKVPLTNWRLPAFTLPPNTYLVVWASGKNRSNPAGPLHTNFRLNNSGEYLALIDPTGTNIISHFDPTYPAQRSDTSFGRDPLDPSVTGYYPGTSATPGAINSTSGNGTDFAPDVQFSRDSGTFTGTFNLTLYTESPTAEIRYVLVSTNNRPTSNVTNVPSASSPLYTGPITVDQTLQVRARAFETGKLPSTPISKTYIEISPDVVNFSSDLPMVIVHNFGQGTLPGTGDQTAVIATFDNDLDRSSLTNKPNLVSRIGLNDRGSSTQGQAKQNMAVEFWDEFNQDIDHPLFGMPAESDWVFFSINRFDQGLMHNAIFHWFGRTVGYSSRTRYVEVFRKTGAGPVTAADYFGLFLIEEKPKRNANRVDIASLQPENTNSATVSGGYLLRIDRVDADERTVTVPTINTHLAHQQLLRWSGGDR
ncbi:MAG: lamin tail domain-containing protein [Verrucomicrobia bacterium]|nr:lamin tail domain-containing protein [Verrucomicrobiota bacterium]